MNVANSSKMKMTTGILQLVWAELKTLNVTKIKSLYKIGVGYLGMKFFSHKKANRKKQKATQQKELQEAAYRLSS